MPIRLIRCSYLADAPDGLPSEHFHRHGRPAASSDSRRGHF
jgi:hypothetical protein